MKEPKAVIKEVSVPRLDKNEVLIKVAYVAQNPIGEHRPIQS
jgi:NADPH:quinone reductase-like Zn-dependent oxidoreductase